jgi:hypothetical protein
MRMGQRPASRGRLRSARPQARTRALAGGSHRLTQSSEANESTQRLHVPRAPDLTTLRAPSENAVTPCRAHAVKARLWRQHSTATTVRECVRKASAQGSGSGRPVGLPSTCLVCRVFFVPFLCEAMRAPRCLSTTFLNVHSAPSAKYKQHSPRTRQRPRL